MRSLSPRQVDIAQAAFGGLAYAIGLAVFLYPGKANRSVWQRLQQIAEGQWTIEAVTGAAADATSSDPAAATQGTTRAVVQAATSAVIQAVREKKEQQQKPAQADRQPGPRQPGQRVRRGRIRRCAITLRVA